MKIFALLASDRVGFFSDPAMAFLPPLCLLLVSAASTEDTERECAHGTFSCQPTGLFSPETGKPEQTCSCACHPAWRVAGPTDAIEFLEGKCTQYECVSSEMCRHATGVAEAECVVPGWNCLCPLRYAIMGSFLGYDTNTDQDGRGYGGRCMGLLYWISVRGGLVSVWWLWHGYVPFLLAALVLLPFGQRRVRCTHHRPGVWNLLRRCVGHAPCDLRCVERSSWEDDYAWSLWSLEWCVWFHLVVLLGWLTCLWVWCVAVWLMVIVILVCAAIAGLFAACLGGLGGGGGSGNGCDDCCKNCDCPTCGSGDCGGCFGADRYAVSSPDYIFFYGGSPGGDCNSNCGEGCDCRWCCSCACCRPFLFLLSLLPPVPRNLLGGWLGRCLGTHVTSPAGRDQWPWLTQVLALHWNQSDAHADGSWRAKVRAYVTAPQVGAAPLQQSMGPLRVPLRPARAPGAVTEQLDRPFNPRDERISENSWVDYIKGECWICMGTGDKFDLYSCGQIFCADCSSTMRQRAMPCPLCRDVPRTVLRAPGPPTDANSFAR